MRFQKPDAFEGAYFYEYRSYRIIRAYMRIH